jgi:hypothetical protein
MMERDIPIFDRGVRVLVDSEVIFSYGEVVGLSG